MSEYEVNRAGENVTLNLRGFLGRDSFPLLLQTFWKNIAESKE